MICLIITIGYYGKYAINLLLNFILKKIYGEGYNKEKYFIWIIVLYFSSLLFSIIIYSFFNSLSEKIKKKKKKKKTMNIEYAKFVDILFILKKEVLKKIPQNINA